VYTVQVCIIDWGLLLPIHLHLPEFVGGVLGCTVVAAIFVKASEPCLTEQRLCTSALEFFINNL
jgi:hypothetical protein